jgi:hypothetical protein
MKYVVNNAALEYHPEGEAARGEEVILLENGIDLTSGTGWHPEGFTTAPLTGWNSYLNFENQIESLLRSLWCRASIDFPAALPLDQYHTVARDFDLHHKAIQQTKLLNIDEFPSGIKWLEERIGEICKQHLIAKNPFDNQSVFHFRVVRPGQNDNNPLHRDIWLEDYDDCINLYIPVCGSDENSSLIVIPGSHLWPESRLKKTKQGAIINGLKFNVPAVTSIFGQYEVIRPNPLRGEVLVFSPYLIHGGAINLNQLKTRISIELRLWKKS